MEMCQEKDEMISKLQTALDHNVEAANEDVSPALPYGAY